MSWEDPMPVRKPKRDRRPEEVVFDLKILLCLSLAANFTLAAVVVWLTKQ